MGQRENKPEWLTLGLIVGCYACWLVSGLLWQTPFWLIGLVTLPVLATFHGSLQHETIHGHPTRWLWLNEFLVSLPIGMVFPYRRYRDLHLKHHNDLNLTDPYEDPESYFWPLEHYQRMRPLMKRLFEINNTFVGRLLVGPALTLVGFCRTEFFRLKRGEAGVRAAWVLHVLGLIAVGVVVSLVFNMSIWAYVLFVVYPALSLTSMRAYAEHQAAENVGARSAIVETNSALSLLYLNNNLHIVHHANPTVSWNDIPELYAQRKTQFLAANENTLFNGYGEIARRFAFTVKQPVSHPFLCCDEAVEK